MRERLVRAPMSESESLVGRAVEVAAREQSDRRTMTPWGETSQWWRERHRAEIEAAVKAALGVVADHCDARVDAPFASDDRASAFHDLAAELRETPE